MQRKRARPKKKDNPGAGGSTTSKGKVCVEAEEQHTRAKNGKLLGSGRPRRPQTLRVFKHDLDTKTFYNLMGQPILQIDTETDGLDFRTDKLRLVQLGTKQNRVYMVHHPDEKSYRLQAVLLNGYSTKYFHHALFDLRFLKFWLGVDLQDVECTKTLMKMVFPDLPSGLVNSVKKVLGVKFDQKRVDYRKWKDNNSLQRPFRAEKW